MKSLVVLSICLSLCSMSAFAQDAPPRPRPDPAQRQERTMHNERPRPDSAERERRRSERLERANEQQDGARIYRSKKLRIHRHADAAPERN